MLSRMMLNLHRRAEVTRHLAPSTAGDLPLSTVDFVGRRISFVREYVDDGSVHQDLRDAAEAIHTDVEIARLPSPTYASGERLLVE